MYFNIRRTSYRFGWKEVKEPPPVNPDRPVLAVAPLNSVPYIGPQMPSSNNDHRLPMETTSSTKEAEPVERIGPAMIFLPSSTTREEWNNVMETTKVGVALTGSAAMGKIGPTIGLVDIGESEDSYLFRVSLPGVSRDESKFDPYFYHSVDELFYLPIISLLIIMKKFLVTLIITFHLEFFLMVV